MGRKIATATFLSSILLLGIQYSGALVTPQPVLADRPTTTRLHAQKKTSNNNIAASTILATSVLIGAAASWNPAPVQAYVPSDYASETVQEAVTALKAASGDADATFKVYETINGVITEGKGVGGMVNYKGIQLERGYVADEDTAIYNPGLTLLTESEKERLVESVIQSRKDCLSTGQWSQTNEYGYEFLKTTLDPLHMAELSGFLGFVPVYGALIYLAVLAVQQNVKTLFTQAYLAGVAAFFLPIIGLILAGP